MLRLNRLVQTGCWNRASVVALQPSIYEEKLTPLSSQCAAQKTSIRFLDIYHMGNKSAIEKERARLSDEMSRGYFADMSELKKHGGKIAVANRILIPAAEALKFPDLGVTQSGGVTFKLPPVSCKTNSPNIESSSLPKASLVCLSFRASSQVMVDSWIFPFQSSFSNAQNIHIYEVSLIDSWLLCRGPIKQLLLRFMRKVDLGVQAGVKRQIVYSFGDHYYFRKELKILNLLTGYIFLLDQFGRIRWQGSGMATEEEMSSLFSCTSLVLKEK